MLAGTREGERAPDKIDPSRVTDPADPLARIVDGWLDAHGRQRQRL